jgi:hypothetical protein
MTWDLSGHMYGVQLVLKRKDLTDDMAVDAPRGAHAFDYVTDVVQGKCRSNTIQGGGLRRTPARVSWLPSRSKA